MPTVLTAVHWRLNRSHPITAGLRALVLPGISPVNLVDGVVGTYGASNQTVVTQAGVARFQSASSTSDYMLSVPHVTPANNTETLLVWWGAGTSSAANQVLVGTENNVIYNKGSGSVLSYFVTGPSEDNAFNSPLTHSTTEPVLRMLVVVRNGPVGTVTAYENGARIQQMTGRSSANSPATTVFRVGNGGLNWSYPLAARWDRALGATEVASLWVNPFQVLEPTRGRRTVIILNSGASSTPAQDIGSATGTITLSGVAGAITPAGGPTIGAATGTITLTGVNGAITSGGANIGSATGTITLSGVAGAISPAGGPTIGAATGTITLTGVAGAISFPATADPNGVNFTFRETGHTTTYRERA